MLSEAMTVLVLPVSLELPFLGPLIVVRVARWRRWVPPLQERLE